MRSKVQQWGNSLALRIPKYIAKQIQINSGSNVDVVLEEEKIVIIPVKDKNEQLNLLLSNINSDNLHTEEDFGDSVGGEVW